MDDVTKANRNLDLLYPEVRVRLYKLITAMKEHYKPIFLVEGYRSPERQKWLYEKGPRKVTKALPGRSFHQYGLACDVAFLDANPYADYHPWLDLRRMAISIGFQTISTFNKNLELVGDKPHMQCTFGYSTLELDRLYQINGLPAVWASIDQKRGVQVGSNWYGPAKQDYDKINS